MTYGNYNNQQRPPRKPCSGRVWPAKKRSSPNSPHFTGEIALPDGHVMRVSMWEQTDKQGMFNGFSFQISEDTRQGNGYQAQGNQGRPQGYGQQGNGYAPQGGGYAPQNGYSAPQAGYAAPQAQNGQQQPYAPPTAYSPQDEGYVPGFDD